MKTGRTKKVQLAMPANAMGSFLGHTIDLLLGLSLTIYKTFKKGN